MGKERDLLLGHISFFFYPQLKSNEHAQSIFPYDFSRWSREIPRCISTSLQVRTAYKQFRNPKWKASQCGLKRIIPLLWMLISPSGDSVLFKIKSMK